MSRTISKLSRTQIQRTKTDSSTECAIMKDLNLTPSPGLLLSNETLQRGLPNELIWQNQASFRWGMINWVTVFAIPPLKFRYSQLTVATTHTPITAPSASPSLNTFISHTILPSLFMTRSTPIRHQLRTPQKNAATNTHSSVRSHTDKLLVPNPSSTQYIRNTINLTPLSAHFGRGVLEAFPFVCAGTCFPCCFKGADVFDVFRRTSGGGGWGGCALSLGLIATDFFALRMDWAAV